MAHESHYIHPDLKISGFTEHFHKSDVLFEEHLLVWFISGETKIIQGGQTYRFGAGDTLFFPRHELVRVINYPKDGLPHQSVVMHLTSQRLEAYYAKNKVDVKPVPKPRFRTFDKHPLLQSCLASLVPYFDLCEPLPEALAAIKIEEAVTILRMLAPDIDNLLADFGEPGKNGSTSLITSSGKRNGGRRKFTSKPGSKTCRISGMHSRSISAMRRRSDGNRPFWRNRSILCNDTD